MEDNPYQAPAFTDQPMTGVEPGFPPGSSGRSEAEIRAFVGKKADYYLTRWSEALHDGGRVRGFNWAAFLLSGLWLPYRKLYRIAIIFFVIVAAESVLEALAVAAGFATEAGLSALGSLVGLVAAVVIGSFGNAWYLAHAKRQIAQVRALGLQDDAYFAALARRGGTSLPASFGLFFLFLFALFLVGVALEYLSAGA
jgi:hypothetical protein